MSSANGNTATPRFERRWTLVGAGLSNVWRFGDLELPAPSGRLLLRGPNGTGKTTALEALLPYLLDLRSARLSAGKARTTTLASLMREGAEGKRRYGYVWMTLRHPREGLWSFGVRLQYSDGASPPVVVVPFVLPGRPLHELRLYAPGRGALSGEQFNTAVAACGGSVFKDEEEYVAHVSARLLGTSDQQRLSLMTARLRELRNPTLLADISADAAGDALRESLPGVTEDVVLATAEALAESEATRTAFARDKRAAESLEDFRLLWCAHAAEVVAASHSAAQTAAGGLRALQLERKTLAAEHSRAKSATTAANHRVEALDSDIRLSNAEVQALKESPAYKDSGRLSDLRRTLAAQDGAAQTSLRHLLDAAAHAASASRSLERGLEGILEDITEQVSKAAALEPSVALIKPLSWVAKPRELLRAGSTTADPGSEVIVSGKGQVLREVAGRWRELARDHAVRGDAATLAIADLKPVQEMLEKARLAEEKSREAALKAETDALAATQASVAARTEGENLLARVSQWTHEHSRLTESSEDAAGTEDRAWTHEDLDRCRGGEPGQVLRSCDEWASHAGRRARWLAAALLGRADRATNGAAKLKEEAAALRQQATDLRAGRLLPLPRPAWAGDGDDGLSLGAVLDWAPDFEDARSRALLESGLAAAGLLGASLGESGAATRYWRVDALGPAVEPNLTSVLSVDASHPLANAAVEVIRRVRLAASAQESLPIDPESALVLGRDGSFRAGVLRGLTPGAEGADVLPPASHVGARQRRAAAEARALELDREAERKTEEADQLRLDAASFEAEAKATVAKAEAFPTRDELRASEATRSATAGIALRSRASARTAAEDAARLSDNARQARREWLERTRDRGLPTDANQLETLRDSEAIAAQVLREGATQFESKLAGRLDNALQDYCREETTGKLREVEASAKQTVDAASSTRKELETLERIAGAAVAEVLASIDTVSSKLAKLEGELHPARKAQSDAVSGEAQAGTKLAQAETECEKGVGECRICMEALRALLRVRGVASAVLDQEPGAHDDELLIALEKRLRGLRTVTRKTLRERADAYRAELAGTWAIDPGEDHGELLTYVLTHKDATYDPMQAAHLASTFSERAQRALAASEEKVLREFVIGRLPAAISTAWTELQDWVVGVNRKMRAAEASSGVGVQVRIPLRENLTAADRAVYELSCRVSDAERTPDQQQRLAAALQSLLNAAAGDTMSERVRSAIDIRNWIDVNYEITRPGGKTQRWGPRTGLSGGERRLVVLAPMLAAVAAAYDRFGQSALRLASLDEVPAEVDEHGREGLARCIAELDLDLICTSHAWDGCPGAWDGIDAYDFEAGPDGTVVAFPMLVRGIADIPDLASLGPAGAGDGK